MNIRTGFLFGCFFIIVSFAGAQLKTVEAVKNESSVTYLLSHLFHRVESTSHEISCRLEIDPVKKEIATASVRIDVTTFDSGNSNRDSHAMEVIDAITYPDVQFSSTSITQQGDSLKAAGRLTFHGVTKEITISAATAWSGTKLIVRGKFYLSLTDFKIERPSLMMIKVDDSLEFDVNAVFNVE